MSVLQDIRQAFRLFGRSLGPTVLALLSITITIAATTVVFAAVKTVLLDPLPYANADTLVQLRTDYKGARPAFDWVSWTDMQDVMRLGHSFDSLGTYRYSVVNLTGDPSHPPEAVYGLYISSELFPTLGVKPMLGRNVAREETYTGQARVIILSYGLWTRRFNSDPSVLGRSIELNGHACTIIGVMPSGFDFPLRLGTTIRTPVGHMDYWAPLFDDPRKSGRTGGFGAVARLKSGVAAAAASQDLDAISAELTRLHPVTNKTSVLHLRPLRAQTLGFAQTGLWLLMGAATLFMLIGCSNVANLLLARSLMRNREIAVRLALGASPRRIVRQLVTESCVLAVAGGIGGYGLTVIAWTLLPAVAPMTIPRLAAARADGTVLIFAIVVAVLNGILFGLAPALRVSVRDPATSLRESATRGSVGSARNHLRSSLVIAEVTIAVTIVVVGGRLTASFIELLRIDPGFDAKHVLASIVVAASDQYRTPQSHEPLFRGIVNAVRALPGVEAVGTVDALPFSGDNNTSTLARDDDPEATKHAVIPEFDRVSADYLQTMGVRLLDGRFFRDDDLAEGRDVAVINAFAANRLWPGQNAIGKQICINCFVDALRERKRVIGVVSSIRHSGLQEPDGPQVYVTGKAYQTANFLVVRTRRPSSEMAKAVRAAITSVDPRQPVLLSASMSELIADSLADRRFITSLLAITGTLALLLAAAGIYGVISYTTTLRTAEIGVRVALGATPAKIQGLVFRSGMLLASLGIAIGLALAYTITRALRSVLAGLTSDSPVLIASAIALVIATASLACWIPARRATTIDPLTALREE